MVQQGLVNFFLFLLLNFDFVEHLVSCRANEIDRIFLEHHEDGFVEDDDTQPLIPVRFSVEYSLFIVSEIPDVEFLMSNTVITRSIDPDKLITPALPHSFQNF